MAASDLVHEQGGDGPARPPTVRVVLVGRTGLDAELRRDRRVELLRAPGPLDAIGELSDPIDSDSPRLTTVIVGTGAGTDEDSPPFVGAMRLVDPTVRVLLMDDAPQRAWHAAFDGVIPTSTPASMVGRLVFAGAGERPNEAAGTDGAGSANVPPAEEPALETMLRGESPSIRPSTWTASEQPPAPGSVRRGGAVSTSTVGAGANGEDRGRIDLAGAIDAMTIGADPMEPAMQEVRRALGESAAFIPGRAPRRGAGEFAVAHRGRPLGVLVAPGAPHTAASEAASRLGAVLALREQQTTLRDAAFVDDLTGAYNLRYFRRFLGAAIGRAADESAPGAARTVTLLFFDIDDFKRFNDEHGHAAGDEILVETVRLLKSVIRDTDRVCRVGGDEFVVVFNDPEGPRAPGSRPPETVREIAERFQAQISAHRFPKLGEQAAGRLTISGGLATYPRDGRTVEDLRECADERAANSKRQGKNAISYGPGV